MIVFMKSEMGGASGTYGYEESWSQGFGGGIRSKETNLKTWE